MAYVDVTLKLLKSVGAAAASKQACGNESEGSEPQPASDQDAGLHPAPRFFALCA